MTLPQKLTDAYIFVMLLAFPLFPGFHGYAQITDAKFFFFTAATFFCLAAATFFCLATTTFFSQSTPLLFINVIT